MPMHDWTTVEAGTYHTFHQAWAVMIMGSLNRGLMPAGYSAQLDRDVQGPIPDVLTVRLDDAEDELSREPGGVATIAQPNRRVIMTAERELSQYVARANRIAVRNSKRKLVAVVELVSPGNKRGKNAMQQLIDKTVSFINDHVNVLIIDPFPPGKSNPQGIHPLIWEYFDDAVYTLPKRKALTVVSYQTSPQLRAHVEAIAVRDRLPDMPLYLNGELLVNVPLERSYAETCELIPPEDRAGFQ